MFSVKELAVESEREEIPPEQLNPESSTPGFGLTAVEFSGLDSKDQRRALTLIGREIATMLEANEPTDLSDAINGKRQLELAVSFSNLYITGGLFASHR